MVTRRDTFVVAGGEGARKAVDDQRLVEWVAAAAERSRRTASVCTGAFLLAEAGLLADRRATTHWRWRQILANPHPEVALDPDAAYVEALRVERARILLEDRAESLQTVALATGFAGAQVLRRAFHRRLRVSPTAYRERFRAGRRPGAGSGTGRQPRAVDLGVPARPPVWRNARDGRDASARTLAFPTGTIDKP